MKHHVHMNLLERAFFIDASAAELASPPGRWPRRAEIGPPGHTPHPPPATHPPTRPPIRPPTVLVQVPGSFFSHMGVFAKGDRGSTTGPSASSPRRRSAPPASPI